MTTRIRLTRHFQDLPVEIPANGIIAMQRVAGGASAREHTHITGEFGANFGPLGVLETIDEINAKIAAAELPKPKPEPGWWDAYPTPWVVRLYPTGVFLDAANFRTVAGPTPVDMPLAQVYAHVAAVVNAQVPKTK